MKIAIHDVKNSWKGTLILLLAFIGLVVMVLSIYPGMKESIDMWVDNIPEFALTTFGRSGIELSMVGGYLNMEFYQWGWVLTLGIYFAFISSSLISKEIESKTIDMLLSNPVSRARVVLEKFLGLVPAIILMNIVIPIVILGCLKYIDETIDVTSLFYTHLVSVFYLCAVCAIGMLFSVIFDETRRANVVAIGVIFGMYIMEVLSFISEKYAALGKISIIHYYDPGEILVHHTVEASDVMVLFLITAVILVAAVIYFEKRDIAFS
ncbi:MAG: ABC transporter permease subunit [Theionarchaea archaeon]|nr:ABC transporter permease subunit [Theionarchaea archaeon]